MNPTRRTFLLFCVLVSGSILSFDGTAAAQSNADICRAVECSSGSLRCADVTATITDERCEEGVMCCPFPDEFFSLACYEAGGAR